MSKSINRMSEVMVTKNIRGFELSETLAKSAEKLITAVAKSEVGSRDIASTLWNIKENKLLDDSWKGIGEFFEAMTGLSKSSASQYIRTFSAFKNYDNNKWCSLSALVPFSMMTEIAKLYGIVKHTIVIDEDGDKGHKKVETGNTNECGDALLHKFVELALEYDDVTENVDDAMLADEVAKQVLSYIAKEWTNKRVRECIEDSKLYTDYQNEQEKKAKKDNKGNKGNKGTGEKANTEDTDEKNYNALMDIIKLVEEYEKKGSKMSKVQFCKKFHEITGV